MRTVAYVPQSIEGHAVLVAIACQEIVMAKDASMGAAGVDEPAITPTLRSAYTEIANRRRTVPAILALGMLDPALEVLDVETETGSEFVTPDGLAQLKKQHTTKEPVVVKRAGEQGEFTGSEARRWSIARYLAADRRELVRALELPPAAVENDPSLESGWRAVRVDLKGPLRADSVRSAQNLIEQQIRERDVNFVCLWIDSPGGSVADAMDLANFLAFGLDPSKVRTVAYVPVEARADAAIVALACDQLVMHPRAVLGDPGPMSRRPRKCNRSGKPWARSWPRAKAAPGRWWRRPGAMKTNAMRILDTLGIHYDIREYEVDPDDLSAEHVAGDIGLPPEQVFKTLVARGDRHGVLLAVVPANAEVDLKALARQSNNRTVELVALKEVQPLTGYIRGGVTALAGKRDYPVYVDEQIQLFDVVAVSAGVRGKQMLLAPDDYLLATGASVGPISRAGGS